MSGRWVVYVSVDNRVATSCDVDVVQRCFECWSPAFDLNRMRSFMSIVTPIFTSPFDPFIQQVMSLSNLGVVSEKPTSVL